MATLFIGTVVWVHPEKSYGFIEVAWGQNIFFHFADGRDCMIKNEEVVFYKQTNYQNKFVWLRKPVKGDNVQFIYAKGSLDRPKAKPWTFDGLVTQAYIDEFEDNKLCSCGHKMSEHSGGECMLCHCGDEAYEHDQDEPHQVWFTESPGGHNGWE